MKYKFDGKLSTWDTTSMKSKQTNGTFSTDSEGNLVAEFPSKLSSAEYNKLCDDINKTHPKKKSDINRALDYMKAQGWI